MQTTMMSQRLQDRELGSVKEHLRRLTTDELAAALRELPAPDAALAFRLLDKTTALDVFETLDPATEVALLEAMTSPDAVAVVSALDVDDQARLLDEAPAKVAARLLAAMPQEARDQVAAVLAYAPGTAGRLANPRYVAVRVTGTAGSALCAVKASPLGPEDVTTVFLVDADREYRGLVTVAELVKAGRDVPLADLARLVDVSVATDDDGADAARLLQRRDLGALAVLDRDRRLVGAVTYDDAMDTLDDEVSETMYRKAGMGDPAHARELLRSERLTRGPIWYPVRVRIAFLMVTLVGGLLVGGLIDHFEDVLAAVVAVAIFIPVIMDMGGNVGTQSTTIFARGLALGHIDPRRFGRQLAREVVIGAAMALVLGALGGTVAYLWQGAPNGMPMLGVAVGVSLFVSVTLATFLGFALPWLMLKIGLDHAPGADPFITTIKDFSGLAVYFSLVAALLGVG